MAGNTFVPEERARKKASRDAIIVNIVLAVVFIATVAMFFGAYQMVYDSAYNTEELGYGIAQMLGGLSGCAQRQYYQSQPAWDLTRYFYAEINFRAVKAVWEKDAEYVVFREEHGKYFSICPIRLVNRTTEG